ncbi:DEAD/DEAH box helicase [Streptomyces sp. NPDC012438]|uniref:DEAD/DEAH box helicase n=1 Tax=Streptomyces sp. NPDC012438 TaxID=3364833 RepID=UPI0036EAF1BB
MERTLDPAVLATVLGVYQPGGVLPTPEALLEAITSLEIAAFRTEYEVSDETLSTAWLLHGLAALEPDAPGFDRDRIRHAFAVSAHVLDLALADERRSPADRLQIAFAAQAGYRRCEQDPNATAVYRRVARLVNTDADLPTHIGTLAVEAGVAFLGLDRPALVGAVRTWRRQFAGLRTLLGLGDPHQSLAGTMFGPAEAVVEAVHHLQMYLVLGEGDDLRIAREFLASVVEQRAGEGDRLAPWVAAHLMELSGELADSSLYQLLPTGTPGAVARTFALSSPPVLTLWPPQRELLRLERGNPVDPATTRSLISVPTSAGKTLMAQLVICSHLAQRPGRVLYVSPMRSLGREMRAALRGRLRGLGYRLAAERPDFPVDRIDFFRGPLTDDVEIVTPERLMHMIRNNPEAALDDVGLIVIDEAHHLAQGRRGFVLESLLTFLVASTYDVRLVLLSAAVGNRAQLASWLEPDRPPQEVAFTDTWRGPRRLHGLIYPSLLKNEAVLAPRRATANQPSMSKATVPVAMRLDLRPTTGSKVAHLITSQLGKRTFASADPRKWNAQTKLSGGIANYKLFAAGAAALTKAGSVLMVVDTKRAARDTALAIADHLDERPEAAHLTEYLADTLGAEHPLVRCTRNGVAYHHGDLPDDVLQAIETALRENELQAIASTSTLTDGVNLPVRTVIVHSSVEGDQRYYEGQRQMLASELLNAVGRAGRAGRESEGWILLTRPYPPTSADFDTLTPDTDQLTVTSALLTEQALAELSAAEDQLRANADAVFALADSITADFTAFVWFLLHAQASTPALSGEQSRLAPVWRLLAMDQDSDMVIATRWHILAMHVVAAYDRTDADSARRWATTGTSLHSARLLDRLARDLSRALAEQYAPEMPVNQAGTPLIVSQEWPLNRTLNFLAEHHVFEQLLDLPEAARAWNFTTRERAGSPVEVSITTAVQSWVTGESIPRLASIWMPDIPAEWALEQAVRCISSTFEHVLSWTLGALINLVNETSSREPGTPLLNTQAAWHLRHGVDTEQALALLTSGINSRRLAHAIGSDAAAQGIQPTDLRRWLTAQDINGWIASYGAKPYEIDDLLDYVRTPSNLVNDLVAGGTVTIPIRPSLPVGDAPATLLRPTSASANIGIEVGDQLVAIVPPDRHIDVLAMLDGGFDLHHRLRGNNLITNRASLPSISHYQP